MTIRKSLFMGTFWALIIITVFALLLASSRVLMTHGQSMGRIELVSHDYECMNHDGCGGGGYDEGDDWGGGGSDGNSGGEYGGGRSGDNDQRGDHNCRNFCFYGVPAPGGGDQPQSLFPPTPDGIRDFVLATIKAGIEMGRLFADTTITFVTNLLVGIA